MLLCGRVQKSGRGVNQRWRKAIAIPLQEFGRCRAGVGSLDIGMKIVEIEGTFGWRIELCEMANMTCPTRVLAVQSSEYVQGVGESEEG